MRHLVLRTARGGDTTPLRISLARTPLAWLTCGSAARRRQCITHTLHLLRWLLPALAKHQHLLLAYHILRMKRARLGCLCK